MPQAFGGFTKWVNAIEGILFHYRLAEDTFNNRIWINTIQNANWIRTQLIRIFVSTPHSAGIAFCVIGMCLRRVADTAGVR